MATAALHKPGWRPTVKTAVANGMHAPPNLAKRPASHSSSPKMGKLIRDGD